MLYLRANTSVMHALINDADDFAITTSCKRAKDDARLTRSNRDKTNRCTIRALILQWHLLRARIRISHGSARCTDIQTRQVLSKQEGSGGELLLQRQHICRRPSHIIWYRQLFCNFGILPSIAQSTAQKLSAAFLGSEIQPR